MKRLLLSLLISFLAISIYAQNNAPVLLSNTYLHTFSDLSKKDLFKLTLTGKTILKGKVLFEIITRDHRVIHSETFPATDLYGDLDEDFSTPKQRIDTVKARFKAFFNPANFKTPAIAKSEVYSKFNDDNYDKVTFYDIKSNPVSIGFLYCHGYEGTYGIAWSKKQKKVVQYFYSD